MPSLNEIIVADPVSDEVFEAYLNVFDYDPVPPEPVDVEDEISTPYWTRQRISFSAGGDGERMALYLYLPKNNSSKFQTIIYWPTITALLVDSVDQTRVQLDFALKNGRAVALPVLDGTFERRRPNFPDWSTIEGRDLAIRQMKEMRRSIDYLVTRDDIDSEALAFYGFSWGGRIGPMALVVEPRLKVGVLNVAGLQHLTVPEISVCELFAASRRTCFTVQRNGTTRILDLRLLPNRSSIFLERPIRSL